jgi:hypothetical protein
MSVDTSAVSERSDLYYLITRPCWLITIKAKDRPLLFNKYWNSLRHRCLRLRSGTKKSTEKIVPKIRFDECFFYFLQKLLGKLGIRWFNGERSRTHEPNPRNNINLAAKILFKNQCKSVKSVSSVFQFYDEFKKLQHIFTVPT